MAVMSQPECRALENICRIHGKLIRLHTALGRAFDARPRPQEVDDTIFALLDQELDFAGNLMDACIWSKESIWDGWSTYRPCSGPDWPTPLNEG